MEANLQELRRVLGGLRILGPTAFILGGHHFPVDPRPDDGRGLPPLVTALQQQLYQYAYSQRYREPLPAAPPMPLQDDMTATLAQANTSRDRWSQSWQVTQLLPNGQVAVQRYGQTVHLWPGEFVSLDGSGLPLRPGGYVNRYHPRDSTTMQPGFYFAFGASENLSEQLGDSVRFYWNLRASGAALWLEGVTARLNFYKVPFRAKCVTHAALYYRRDPALIYTASRYTRIVAELSSELYPRLQPHLEADVPLFTLPLAPGVGFAEEPGEPQDSFGTHRCRLLALGIVQAYQHNTTTLEGQLAAIQQQFAQAGLQWAHPYLRAGSVARYEFPPFEVTP